MATFTPILLSGSTNGRPIKITTTATAGDLIHTEASTSGLTLLYLWASNTSTSDVKLTLEWGGVTSPDDLIEFTVPAEDGLYVVAPGLYLSGGVVVRAFAGTGNVLNIVGHAAEVE